MNRTKQLFLLSRAIHTQITRNAVAEAGPRSARVKELQKRLQVDDGVPVHLKGGAKDKMLFGFTVVLTGVGIIMSLETVYRIGSGKK